MSFSCGASAATTSIMYAEYVHVDVELAGFNEREPAGLFQIQSIAFTDGNSKICIDCTHAHVNSPKWV